MAGLQEMFGAKLLTKDGLKATTDVLSGTKAIAIYFSGHWCPPCRGFTPKLAEWYSSSFKGKGLEIVFVSSDKSQEQFDDYYKEHPWVALPFDNRSAKDALSKKFKVNGIPFLVILDGEGNLINKEGRDAVSNDPQGEKFPWYPPTKAEKAKAVLDCLGPELLAKTNGKPIGLYFSAHWCPPCRDFTPKLTEWYKDGLKDKMEIIFVSSDRDEESFNSYYGDMPWLALPFDKRKEKVELSGACGVEGIPTFAVLNQDGTIVTTDGVSKVSEDSKADTFPEGWLPKPFNDVNDDPSPLNTGLCLIMLGDSTTAHEAVKAVADEEYEKAGKDVEAMPVKFFRGPAGGVTEQLRNLTGQKDDKLILLDIPDDGGFYVCDGDAGSMSADVVKQFIADVNAKKVERKQLKK